MRFPIQKLVERLERLQSGVNSGLVYHGLHTRRVIFGFSVADPISRTERTFGRACETAQFLHSISRRPHPPEPAA